MKLKTKLAREMKRFKKWNEKHGWKIEGRLSHRENEGWCVRKKGIYE